MNENKSIYTITSIPHHSVKGANLFRIVGFYFDIDKARDVVLNNYGSLDECAYYQYIVIEEIKEGLYHMVEKEEWYSWRKDKWVKTRKPRRFKQCVNFSMG